MLGTMSKQKFNFRRDIKNYDYRNDLFTPYSENDKRSNNNNRRNNKKRSNYDDDVKYAKWQ